LMPRHSAKRTPSRDITLPAMLSSNIARVRSSGSTALSLPWSTLSCGETAMRLSVAPSGEL